jgi:hypothetical protein
MLSIFETSTNSAKRSYTDFVLFLQPSEWYLVQAPENTEARPRLYHCNSVYLSNNEFIHDALIRQACFRAKFSPKTASSVPSSEPPGAAAFSANIFRRR